MLNATQLAHRAAAESLLFVAKAALGRIQLMSLEPEMRVDLTTAGELINDVFTTLKADLDGHFNS